MEYSYPFPTDGSRGLPAIKSGPSGLKAGQKPEGSIDYANVKDAAVTPENPFGLPGPDSGTDLRRSVLGPIPQEE